MGPAAEAARKEAELQRTTKKGSSPGRSIRQEEPAQDWLAGLPQQIQTIATDDPHFTHKVFRIFLASVLAAEFGSSLRTDPRFMAMVDGVQQQMESDPELTPMIERAVLALTDSSSTSR